MGLSRALQIIRYLLKQRRSRTCCAVINCHFTFKPRPSDRVHRVYQKHKSDQENVKYRNCHSLSPSSIVSSPAPQPSPRIENYFSSFSNLWSTLNCVTLSENESEDGKKGLFVAVIRDLHRDKIVIRNVVLLATCAGTKRSVFFQRTVRLGCSPVYSLSLIHI